MPCAVLGHIRPADVLNEVGTPECDPHHEFGMLAASKQREVTEAWSNEGSAIGVIGLLRAYRESDPDWFARFGRAS